MYKYRVVGSVFTGNGKKLYDILDLETGEVLHKYASFFKEQGDDAFINVSVRGKNGFSILRSDKGTKRYEMNQNRVKHKKEW